MATPGFYNENINRDYPFIYQETGTLPEACFADFGCILGVDAEFEEGTHNVYLSRMQRLGNYVEIEFTTDAPGLLDQVLVFRRQLDDSNYTTSYAEAVSEDDPARSRIECSACSPDSVDCDDLDAPPCHGDPSWSGYLVTGKMSAIRDFLTACAPDECNPEVTVCTWEGEIPVEPSLITNLSQSYIRSMTVANSERTRASSPAECRDYCWPFTQEEHYLQCECVTGGIRFKEGYNTCITQDALENTITINACAGGGEGVACEDVKVTEDEAPPTGRNTLDGALKCDEIIRTINGVGKRFFEITGGTGVTITPVPDENKIIVDINLKTLAICPDLREQSSTAPEESSVGPCACGPAEEE